MICQASPRPIVQSAPVVAVTLSETVGRRRHVFTFDAPIVTSVVVPEAPDGAGLMAITVVGSNFGKIDMSAQCNVLPQPGVLDVSWVSETAVVARGPAGIGKLRTVSVEVLGLGGTMPSVSFDFPPPELTGMSPSNGSPLGGTVITLWGSQLVPQLPLVLGDDGDVTLEFVELTGEALVYKVPPAAGSDLVMSLDSGGGEELVGFDGLRFSYDIQDCVVSEWDKWTDCTASCSSSEDESTMQIRSRQVLLPANGGGLACPDLQETNLCTGLPPCPTAAPVTATAAPTSLSAVTDGSDGLARSEAPTAEPSTPAPTVVPSSQPPSDSPTARPSIYQAPAPPGQPPPPPRYACANDCSGHGSCDYSRGQCVCSAGWLGDCSMFVFESRGFAANTSELGDSAVLEFVPRQLQPTSDVLCDVTIDTLTEAEGLVSRVLIPGGFAEADSNVDERRRGNVTVVGVKDLVDDGDMPFSVAIGPCQSDDPRFNIPDVRTIAVGYNRHIDFPRIESVQPSVSSVVGQAVVLKGEYFDENCSVEVNSIVVNRDASVRDVLWNLTSGEEFEARHVHAMCLLAC